jgi:hypothetical protein
MVNHKIKAFLNLTINNLVYIIKAWFLQVEEVELGRQLH